MAQPVLTFYLLFRYVPVYGILIAFQKYKGAASGLSAIWNAGWIGLKNFQVFFTSISCGRIFRNTVTISLLRLAFRFPAPILLALILFSNQLSKRLGRSVLGA